MTSSVQTMAAALGLALAASCAIGCTVEEPPARVGGVVMVDRAPPVERVEVPPPAPGPKFVWIRGHWYWNGQGWLWIAGHWRAQRPGYQFVRGHWETRGGEWVWVEGYWRRL